MSYQWTKRKSHFRRLKSGCTVRVAESWILRDINEQVEKKQAFVHGCPKCGARILSVHMPNGGWAHFESGEGLSRVKHPCLHLGEGLGKKRDLETDDLFDDDWKNKKSA